jgi:hypothetical protein
MTKKIIGFVLLFLSCCSWLSPFFVGLLKWSPHQLAALVTALLIAGEICFLLSMVFLGKAFFNQLKNFIKVRWRFFRYRIHKKKAVQ